MVSLPDKRRVDQCRWPIHDSSDTLVNGAGDSESTESGKQQFGYCKYHDQTVRCHCRHSGDDHIDSDSDPAIYRHRHCSKYSGGLVH